MNNLFYLSDEEVLDLSESINMIDLTESDDENTPSSPCREKSFSTVSNVKLKSAAAPLSENRRILNEVTNTVETVANVANAVDTVANANVPLGENSRILNEVTNTVGNVANVANIVNTVANAVVHGLTGSRISSQVNTQRVSSQNTDGFGRNYNESSVNSHRRNNQFRNHNKRPYDRTRGDNQYRQNRYGSTDSPSRRNNTQLLTYVEVAMECY